MVSDDEKAKLRFDLANANAQSISRAQDVYVTALLAYLCIVWGSIFVGTGEASLHFGWADLKVGGGVWIVTPFVLLVLTLAYIGTLTAFQSAHKRLRAGEKELFGSQEHSLFDVDTHKNLIDYLAILQLFPFGPTREQKDASGHEPLLRRFGHLILPILFVISAFTSYWAIHQSQKLGSSHRVEVIFGWCCFTIQIVFSLRPMRRFVWRFFGAKHTSDVYK